jgi:hypothetical protein
MSWLSGSYGALGIMVAASGAADYTLIRVRFVAVVHCLAKTAGVYWRSRNR